METTSTTASGSMSPIAFSRPNDLQPVHSQGPGDLQGPDASSSNSSRGDVDLMLAQLYDRLRRRASQYLRRERMDHTLQPTALVHETYLRLARQRKVDWHNGDHVFAVASRLMRRILIDHARRRSRLRRGGDLERVDWSSVSSWLSAEPRQMLALDEALIELQEAQPTLAEVVTMRFFGGFKNAEIAEALGVSVSTVAARWAMARTWLFQRLGEDPARGGDVEP